jgi:hypothetical protein
MEPRIKYFVGSKRSSGSITVREWDALPSEKIARQVANDYNEEEVELAAMERRDVRVQYVPLRGTTTYEEL